MCHIKLFRCVSRCNVDYGLLINFIQYFCIFFIVFCLRSLSQSLSSSSCFSLCFVKFAKEFDLSFILSWCFRYTVLHQLESLVLFHPSVASFASRCLCKYIYIYFKMYSLFGSHSYFIPVSFSLAAHFRSSLSAIKSCSIFFNLHIKYLFISPASELISSILNHFCSAFRSCERKKGKFSYRRDFVSIWRACVVGLCWRCFFLLQFT